MKRLLGAFVGLLVGGSALGADVCAQASGTGPAYVIAEVEPDPAHPAAPADAQRYAREAPATIAAFGGRYVAVGGRVATLEGEAPRGYIVIIGFDSLERAQAWYNSPAYAAIRPIRQNSTRSRVLIVEGGAPR